MIEFLVVAGVVSAVGGAVAGGITYGSRYVDEKLKYEHRDFSLDEPILAPSNESDQKFREKSAA